MHDEKTRETILESLKTLKNVCSHYMAKDRHQSCPLFSVADGCCMITDTEPMYYELNEPDEVTWRAFKEGL